MKDMESVRNFVRYCILFHQEALEVDPLVKKMISAYRCNLLEGLTIEELREIHTLRTSLEMMWSPQWPSFM